jgi:hypothetical protein
MASFVLTEAVVQSATAWTGTAPGPANPTISGTLSSPTDWTPWLEEVKFGPKCANIDFSNFADKGFMSSKPGMISADFSIVLQQDVAAAAVDSVFGPGLLAKTLYYFDVKATSATRGTSNPSWVVAAYIENYPAFGGAVGSKATVEVGFMLAGKFARLTA